MMPILSRNTQAILLLTAPLIAGKDTTSSDLLSPGEYKRLARHLREIQHQPADLLSPDAAEVLRACQPVIDESRLQKLLRRGFLLSQLIDRWQARAIWVVSRADAEYPRRLKARLREDAPAVIYGCGDMALLESGGLAVVGSRHVDDALIDYTMEVGRLAARAGRTLVSGGAKGIDQAAMRSALEADGKAIGVLADSLEKAVMNRDHRNLLLEGRLVLISPYDPNAGFNVGNAMQRNKLIYALAEASLVISSDLNKGGTWTGAVEQLNKLQFVRVYVRWSGYVSPGLQALQKKGALPWPDPKTADELSSVFESTTPQSCELASAQIGLSMHSETDSSSSSASTSELENVSSTEALNDSLESFVKPLIDDLDSSLGVSESSKNGAADSKTEPVAPADKLFATVRMVIPPMLGSSMKENEIAAALDVSTPQARAWLLRLVAEGVIEKRTRPAGYIVKQTTLF